MFRRHTFFCSLYSVLQIELSIHQFLKAFELFSGAVQSDPSCIDRKGVQLLGSPIHKHVK